MPIVILEIVELFDTISFFTNLFVFEVRRISFSTIINLECPPGLANQSTGRTLGWGEVQQGRIPVALVADDEPHYLSVPFDTEAERETSNRLLSDAAARYNDLFDRVLQFYQARCQHHMHKRDRKTGKRVLPNACKAPGKKGKESKGNQ